MAVVAVDPKLVDDLEVVLAPVPNVHKRVVERSAIVADERLSLPEETGGLVNVRSDDVVEESLKLAVSERDPIQGLELAPEVRLKRGPIVNVRAVFVLQRDEPID